MAWEVIGPGLIPEDVKVRCSFCGRSKMLRRDGVKAAQGCRACAWSRHRRRPGGGCSRGGVASAALRRDRARAKGEEAGDG